MGLLRSLLSRFASWTTSLQSARTRLRLGRKRRIGATLVALTAVLCLSTGFRACLREQPWNEVAAAAAPEANPLKGMMPFAPSDPASQPQVPASSPPYTMEWLTLPLNDVVTGADTYDWTSLDARLDAVAARGHQASLRFYVDYPGRPSGMPGYLTASHLVSTRSYSVNGNWPGASVAPDYNDPDMMKMLSGFIAAFGKRYDGDPRLAFITQGLVGFWGEGHTWPMNGKVSGENPSGENWMPSQANQNTLMEAWDTAFNVTPTLVRYPSDESVKRDVGYHDDSFGYATMDDADWHFTSLLEKAGATDRWKHEPVGGEVYPGIQECSVRNPGSCSTASTSKGSQQVDMPAAIKATHATWLVSNWPFTTELSPEERNRAVQDAVATGYNLAVERWRMHDGKFEMQMTNSGVAPFYYNWDVEAVALDANGQELERTKLNGDLRKVLPGKTILFSGKLPQAQDGQTTILVRAVNPLPTGTPLRFASAGQDQTLPGYLTLGTVAPKTS